MGSWSKGALFFLTIAIGVAACGEPAPVDDGSGGTSSGGDGTGGGAASGGAHTGGNHTGGTSSGGAATGGDTASDGGAAGDGGDTGTGGSIPEDAHCAPGDTYGAIAYASLLSTCGSIGGGVGDDQQAARSINLDTPIGPGDTYAFSVDMMSVSNTKMELWGATEECGDGLELLATAVMGLGVRCMEVSPQEGTYSHLSWVWFAGGGHGDVTTCPEGTCGE